MEQFDSLDPKDLELKNALPRLRRVKVSDSFATEVHMRIREQVEMSKGAHSAPPRTATVCHSPWRKRVKPWMVALLAHAALFAIFANIYLQRQASENHLSDLRVVLYHQRNSAFSHAVSAQVSSEGALAFSGAQTGEIMRMVPLKECVGIFSHMQWSNLSSVTRSAYESELGFTQMEIVQAGSLTLTQQIQDSYFSSTREAVVLEFPDRTEIWSRHTLNEYLNEIPVTIQQAAILLW